jgi:hypothetical protein
MRLRGIQPSLSRRIGEGRRRIVVEIADSHLLKIKRWLSKVKRSAATE